MVARIHTYTEVNVHSYTRHTVQTYNTYNNRDTGSTLTHVIHVRHTQLNQLVFTTYRSSLDHHYCRVVGLINTVDSMVSHEPAWVTQFTITPSMNVQSWLCEDPTLRISAARLACYGFRSNDLAPLIHLLVYDTLVTEGNVAVTPQCGLHGEQCGLQYHITSLRQQTLLLYVQSIQDVARSNQFFILDQL